MIRRGACRAGLTGLDSDCNASNSLNLLPLGGSGPTVNAGNRAGAQPYMEHFSNDFR
jgi:hypothetical protein